MTEVIEEIKGFEGRYTISNLGIVRSLMTGKEMKLNLTSWGYYRVNLRYAHSRKFKSFLVHRLVAQHFLPNANNLPEVNHIDSNRLNNRVDNLEWCDRNYNIQHSFKYGYASHKGERNSNHKLTRNDVEAIKQLHQSTNLSDGDIAKVFNVSRSTINHVVSGRSWK